MGVDLDTNLKSGFRIYMETYEAQRETCGGTLYSLLLLLLFSPGVVPLPSSLSEDSLLLVAESPLSVSDGVIALEASLNRGESYSDTGTFTAPGNGIYLFVLTLDLRPGPAQVVLRRRSGGSGGDLVSLHRQEVREAGPVTGVSLLPLSEGEEVRLELMEGAWTESENNVFTVLLLRRTT